MKRFNLLFDSWIPVKTRQKGNSPPIRAYEIVQEDIVALDAPRADFNAALMQFFIGVLQTVMAPKNPREWRIFFNQPPSKDELKRKFEGIKDAFYLNGDSHRFMQDVSIKDQGNTASVIKLIPGIVGDNTVKMNQDIFLKSSQLSKMSVSNLIVALYLYQNYCLSETGGREGRHHGSLRGRNTITTIVIKESGSLWENLWLNIIQDSKFKTLISLNADASNFAWMSDAPNGKQNTDSDMTLKDIYWSMPRRVWINFAELKIGICDLTSEETEVIENIYIKENGIDYKTTLTRHPLIPYFKDDQGSHPIKLTGEGVTYGDWLAVVRSDTASENLLENVGRNLEGKFKILVCGYLNHSQQAKTLCWYQTKMPFYGTSLAKEVQKEIEVEISKYIRASSRIANSKVGYLSVSMRMAWFGYDYWKEQEKRKNKKPDPLYNKAARSLHNHPIEIAKCFWNNTESKFYELIKILYDNAHQLTDEKRVGLRREWHQHIKFEAVKLFDRWAFKSSIQTNPRRIADAHNKLLRNLNSNSLKQDILGLP